MNRIELFEKLNKELKSKMESGQLPWRKTWTNGMPRNFISQRYYNGMNFMFLALQEFPSPEYLTFLQCKQKGGMVNKGVRGVPVIFWKILPYSKRNESGEIENKSFPLMKVSHVFNISDTSLYDSDGRENNQKLLVCEDIINNMLIKPVMNNNLTKCYYNFAFDYISIPPITQFESPAEYYASLFHELVHWTGHATRLDRGILEREEKKAYSFEELVAEIGSSYLCGLTGITPKTIDNSAGYIQGWLSHLNSDMEFFAKAAIKAQQAVGFILQGMNMAQEVENE